MNYKKGDKVKIAHKRCKCMGGGFRIEGEAVLIKEVRPDDDIPVWLVRFEQGMEVNRHLYPAEEIKKAAGAK